MEVPKSHNFDATIDFFDTKLFKELKNNLNLLIQHNILEKKIADSILKYKENEYELLSKLKKDTTHRSALLKRYPQIFNVMDLISLKQPNIKKYYICISIKDFETFNNEFLKLQQTYSTYKVIGAKDFELIMYSFISAIDIIKWINILEKWHMLDIAVYYYENVNAILGSSYLQLKSLRTFEPTIRTVRGNYSKGYRQDLKMSFRSSWEANIARWLNYLGIKFEYETVTLSTNNTGYRPDFIIRFSNYSDLILEVKGLIDERSKEIIVNAIRNGFTGYLFNLIDASLYTLINEKYRNKIPYWENRSQLTKNIYEQARIVGITIANRKKFSQQLIVGDSLVLEWEKNNKHDQFAMKVFDNEHNHIGYISKDFCPYFVLKLQQGFTFKVIVKSISIPQRFIEAKIYFENNGVLEKLELDLIKS